MMSTVTLPVTLERLPNGDLRFDAYSAKAIREAMGIGPSEERVVRMTLSADSGEGNSIVLPA